MKCPKGNLLDLQKRWYKILEDSGFVDIEKMVGGELVLKQTTTLGHNKVDRFDYEMDSAYFRAVYEIAHHENTFFKSEIDRVILQMHACGSKIKDIIYVLKLRGATRNRASVRYIIRKYEMIWNIRDYNPRQLNKKCL